MTVAVVMDVYLMIEIIIVRILAVLMWIEKIVRILYIKK